MVQMEQKETKWGTSSFLPAAPPPPPQYKHCADPTMNGNDPKPSMGLCMSFCSVPHFTFTMEML